MALTGEEKVTVAEIIYETYEKTDGLVSSLNSDQETAVIDYIEIWNQKKNKPHIRLDGGSDGTNLNYDRLLEAVTVRVRIMLGLTPYPSHLHPTGGVFAGGVSKSDMAARNANTDRPSSGFTTDLHRYG